MFKLLNSIRKQEYTTVLTLPQVNLISEAIRCWQVEHLVDGGSTSDQKFKDMDTIETHLDRAILAEMR